ncbi:hypothetical protein G6F43_000791 [Rhizopus delemar]|nr:hypothetical protein G6F43_000791 [Rhizopus delemar]
MLSGWLFKLSSTNKFGASKWQSRYFVLLNTELRYYRDEHAVNSSSTINLADVSKVIRTGFFNHNYCFKLETTADYKQRNPKHQQKTWTMECHSEYELDMWLAAINHQLAKNTLYPSSEHRILQRPPKRSKPSISRRRGLVLSQLEIVPALDHDMSSSKESSPSSLCTIDQIRGETQIKQQESLFVDTSIPSFL